MSDPAVPTARTAWRHAALAAVIVVLLIISGLDGPWRTAVEAGLFGIGLTAVPVALRVHRTSAVAAWYGLAGCLFFFGISCVAEIVFLLGGSPVVGAVEVALDIAAYGCLVAGAVGQLVAGRHRRDREAWVDTLGLLLAGVLATFAFGGTTGLGDDGIGLPLLTAVVLLVCVPLALGGTGRSVSATALLVAGALTIVGFGGQLVGRAAAEATYFDELTLFALAAIVLAGRHPSVARLGQRLEAEEAVTTGRIVSLGAALLVSPAILMLLGVRHGGPGFLLGAGSAVLTGLALWRLAAMNNERERTRTALVASEARLQLLLENAADVIAIVDTSGSVAYMSPAIQSLLGRPPADYLGRQAIDLADPRDQPRLRAAVAAAGNAGDDIESGAVDTDIRVQHGSGGTRWVEMRISARVAAAGIEGWVVNFREVTSRKLFEDELRRQAQTDPLTGLLNRTAFSRRLGNATGAIDPAAPPAVLFVDIDDFKSVNDSLGHAAGDDLLVTVAARLTADVRADDVVARLGGDEFAVLLPDADDERLRDVAARLLSSLRAPMALNGTTLSVTASIGGALGVPGDTADRLLHRADTAMYEAKRSGKNSSTLLDSEATRPA